MRRALFPLLLLAVLMPAAARAELSVRLEVAPASTTPGQSVRATVTVTGSAGDASLDLWVPPEIRATRAGSSRNVQIINGAVQSNTQHFFRIVGDTPGAYTVGPGRIESGGNVITSNTVSLTIVKAAADPEDRTGVFVEAEVDRTDPYMGEQVTYTLRLFRPRRQNFTNFKLVEPDTDGLWAEELHGQQDAATVINGEPYFVHTIQKAYFPTRAGEVVIGATTVGYQEVLPTRRRTRRSFFDDPFFRRQSVQRRVATDPVTLHVRALPNPPAGTATDATPVGVFTMQSTTGEERVRVGESITLTVRVSGRGNLRTLPDMVMPASEDFKAYPDVATVQMEPREGAITGTRIQRVALVPQRAGPLIIPSISLPVFDPERETWVVLKTPARTVTVEPGEEQVPVVIAAAPATAAAPGAAQRLASDLLAPHPLPATLRLPHPRDRLIPAITSVGAPLLFGVSWLMRRRADAHAADPTLHRRRRAARTARTALGQSPPPSPDAVAAILTTYVSDRNGVPAGAITGDESIAYIKDAAPDLEADAVRLIRLGEAARYGGGAAAGGDPAAEALALIAALERADVHGSTAHA